MKESFRNSLKDMDILVVGMGRSGKAAIKALSGTGARLYAQDSQDASNMDEDFLDSVKAKSEMIRSELKKMKKVTGLDGLGLMIGIDLDGMTGAEAVSKLMEEGVLAIPAGKRLRLLPPLTISEDEIKKALEAIRRVLD